MIFQGFYHLVCHHVKTVFITSLGNLDVLCLEICTCSQTFHPLCVSETETNRSVPRPFIHCVYHLQICAGVGLCLGLILVLPQLLSNMISVVCAVCGDSCIFPDARVRNGAHSWQQGRSVSQDPAAVEHTEETTKEPQSD